MIIAHRGGKFWTDNTFSYIAESIRHGADIVELDVRLKHDEYIVQHSLWERPQGLLKAALKRIEKHTTLYLDIKGTDIRVNALLNFVGSICPNHIMIGSFHPSVLREVDSNSDRCLHICLPYNAILRAQLAAADWVCPLPYILTKNLATTILKAGFHLAPAGNPLIRRNEIMKNQMRYAKWGASALSTHHVREMIALLQGRARQFACDSPEDGLPTLVEP